MADLRVIEGDALPDFKGVQILEAAVAFVDAYLRADGATSLGHLQRAEIVISAARLIVDAEITY